MINSHLTNENIYEFLRIHSGENLVPDHVHQCEQCRRQYNELAALFFNIKRDTSFTPDEALWSKIEVKHQLKLHEKRTKRIVWSLMSLAASLMLVIGLQWNWVGQEINLQNQIQATIIQSQQLEKVLLSNQHTQQVGFYDVAEASRLLLEIDAELQIAYQENRNQEFILKLWIGRVELLKQYTKTDKNLALNKIEII